MQKIPSHIGIIPDGNRRWAVNNMLQKQDGYERGVAPGFMLYELMLEKGVKEATFYGFTKDNVKRPKIQRDAFTKACVDAVEILSGRDANLLVIGNTGSPVFPEELRKYANERVHFGKGLININFLVNYDWEWDMACALEKAQGCGKKDFLHSIASADIPRIDLIIRWGGRRRLSGLLPVQSVYADFYVINDYWPDFKKEHFEDALSWYNTQDKTLGG